jgi:hypothetical protein
MSIYNCNQLAELCDKKNNKVQGLALLQKANVPTPDFIYIDDDEYNFYRERKSLSPEVISNIDVFIKKNISNGRFPLFSMRCESKYHCSNIRTPISLLNVGLKSIDDNVIKKINDERPTFFYKTLENTYKRRANILCSNINVPITYKDTLDELVFWLCCLYNKLSEINVNVSCGVIIQQMVYGCWDEKSCSGVCCALPDNEYDDYEFRGIILHKQQGFGLEKGKWGECEYDLKRLLSINNSAYFTLRGIYEYLCSLYGPERYLEFTIESNDVFILEHLTRKRMVVPSQ